MIRPSALVPLLVVLLLAGTAAPAVSAPGDTTVGQRLREFTIDSAALGVPTTFRVLLPSDYDADPDTRYPVLYLLHGGGDDYRAWADKGDVVAATERLPLIVVMPDAANSLYSDWLVPSGRYGRARWETYHLTELIPWVDKNFRTRAERSGRAVAGLSMGGFGAMSFAARHPDLFVSAAAFSGELNTNLDPWLVTLTSVRDAGLPDAIFGPRLTEEVRWRGHNPWDVIENLRDTALTVHTGNGRPGPEEDPLGADLLERIVYRQSVSVHDRLTELGIHHTWHVRDGTHAWGYWRKDLRDTLPWLLSVFADPPAAPVPFSYTAMEPVYEVYGWEVRLTRPALEFSQLLSARPDGFTLAGSGTAVVRTAPWYEPGMPYRVTVTGPHDNRTEEMRADGTGRLALQLTLGPGNKCQQHTIACDTRAYATAVALAAA